MRTRKVIVGTVALALLLAGLVFLWPRETSARAWEPPAPGTVVVEQVGPDSTLVATVRAADSIGQYVFELRSTVSHEVVASQRIGAPVGYHPQLVTIEWETIGHRAVAWIDHDFGDNPLRFAITPQ